MTIGPVLGPDGDNKSKETGIITAWDENGPPLVWHRKLDQSYGIGSVANGRFYQFDGNGPAGTFCLGAQTGELIWDDYPTEYEDLLGYNNGPRAPNQRRHGASRCGGMLHALREHDGSSSGRSIRRRSSAWCRTSSASAVHRSSSDLLIVLVGGSPPRSKEAGRFGMDRIAGNGTGIAFDKRTGEVKYAITDELASYSTPQLADWRPAMVLRARAGAG